MKILPITDGAFRKYGRIVDNVDFTELYEALKTTPLTEEVVYEPSVDVLEAVPVMQELKAVAFGGMPIQIGYCNGHNSVLNAVEYHKNSEINAAASDVVLLLGLQQDVEEDFTYDTAKMEAFLLPAGTAVEFYATTLHYAPCDADGKGFRVAVVLPKGTNYPLEQVRPERKGEDILLKETNKWLIAHPQGNLDESAFFGLKGKNLDINE